MRVLVVKLTSMGDVLHALPAITDLAKAHPDIELDWMVEETFAEIPRWHPYVNTIIPVATRRWRSLTWRNSREFFGFLKQLRQRSYDVVVDAQGLMKSALLCRFARLSKNGVRAGFSGGSIKETPAARLYQRRVDVPQSDHAVDRLRQLFSSVFEYEFNRDSMTYGISAKRQSGTKVPTIMFLHGTTWATKHLPEETWAELADFANEDGYRVALAWGSDAERARAQRIVGDEIDRQVLPKMSLFELKNYLAEVDGVIAVDTGLGHLAAALGVPCVSLYGATDASLTGAAGMNQQRLQSAYPCSPCLLKACPKIRDHSQNPPCYRSLDAQTIWQALSRQIV